VQISHAALLALLNDTAPESDLSIRAESDTGVSPPDMTVFCDSGLAVAREPRATESSTPRAEASPREYWLLYWFRYLR
jgi:hypothetical protein